MFAKADLSYAQRITGDGIYTPVVTVPASPKAVARMRRKVRGIINWWFDGESDFKTCLDRSTDDVMKAFGFKTPKKK